MMQVDDIFKLHSNLRLYSSTELKKIDHNNATLSLNEF